MPLPPYYLGVILTSRMACVLAMMLYRGFLKVVFEFFSKGPSGFSPMYWSLQVRSLHWNEYMAPHLLTIGVFVLGGDQLVFDSAITSEVGLYTIPPTDLFKAFAETLGVWYDSMTLDFNFIGNRLGTCSALAVSPIIDLTGKPGKSFLHLVQSPFWVFTIGKCFPEMLHFFLEKLRIATNSVGPLCESTLITLCLAERWWWLSHCKYWSVCVGFLYTVIDSLPSVSGFTVVSQKEMAPSSLLFSTVNSMAWSTLCVYFLLDDKSVIHIPAPKPGGGGSVQSFLLKVLHI